MSWAPALHSPGAPWPSSRSDPVLTPVPATLVASSRPAVCACGTPTTPKTPALRALPGPSEREHLPRPGINPGWLGLVPSSPQEDRVGRRGLGGMAKTAGFSALIAALCRLVQSAAVAERERVSRLFAEAAAVLQRFQTEVLGFIDEGEATMLGHSQGDLRRQEDQRSRLSQARHNLSQVPEADSVSFLQVRAAL